MAVNFPTQQIVDNFNFWAKYRNQNAPNFDAQQIYDLLKAPYVRPPPPDPPIVSKFTGWPAAPGPRPPSPQIPAEQIQEQNFLSSHPPELASLQNATLAANWRGTKFLGRGGNGLVGLWEYSGPEANPPPLRQVAIKQSLKPLPDMSLENEARFIQILNQAGSDHFVRQITPPQRNAAGHVERLILEYCPMGDMFGMTDSFISR